MPSTPWPNVSQHTLADQAYEAIRNRIVNGELSVGEFVREQEVSEALGVSRTPVREALGRLASEGFLDRIPHRGFRVPEEAIATLLELYPILSVLEILAGKLALARLTSADIRRMEDINERMAELRDSGKVRELIGLNDRFHQVISRRTGNQRLSDLLTDLRSQVKRLEVWYYSDLDRIDDSVAHHEELIQAMENGDHDGVLELLETNMALTYERFSEEYAGDREAELSEVDAEG